MIFVALAALLPYLPLLIKGPVWLFDDLNIVPTARTAANIPSLTGAERWKDPMSKRLFRTLDHPRGILWQTYDLSAYLGGYSARVWVGMNVAIHVMSSLTFFYFAGFFLDPEPAIVAGMFYGVHPLGVMAVGLTSGRSSLLCGFVLLLALAAVVSGHPVLVALAALIVLRVKQEGLSLIPLLLLLMLL